jgi:NAD(P)-dependent dehydrogenase (short-subunit alcohol dehydrogenase family)
MHCAEHLQRLASTIVQQTNLFDLTGRVAIVTGGAGLLGVQHAKAVHLGGGIPVLADLNLQRAQDAAAQVGERTVAMCLDVTSEDSISACLTEVLSRFGQINILINNAARNPMVEGTSTSASFSRFEEQDLEGWTLDVAIGLTGPMLCSKIIGTHMAAHGGGVILNIGSEYALVAPDQRVYEQTGLSPDRQPKKPVSYSVVKHGIIGLTKYLATYWADKSVRVNCLCPGAISNNQPEEFVRRFSNLIPMGRMARPDEMQGAVIFLCSDASRFMTGAVVTVDGGRTIW